MEKEDYYVPVGFFVLLFVAAFIVRLTMGRFESVLVRSQVFFQLILTGTIIAVMRNEVGVDTFGVFAPAIISFAWIQAGPVWGAALFLDVFLIALVTRLVINPFRLGAPHRVAILITTVGISITLIEMVGTVFHMPRLEAAILFPALITSWYADRFADEVEEAGWVPPTEQLFWTMVVITISYFVVSYQPLIQLFVLTPELWVFLILFNLYIGLSVRFRLDEYFRFWDIMKPSAQAGRRATIRAMLHNLMARFVNLFGGSMKYYDRRNVLGMNVRNHDYITKYNPRYLYPALEKIEVKRALHGLAIPTPETYYVVEERRQLEEAKEVMQEREEFVIKPNTGFGGEGIIVVYDQTSETFKTSEGEMTLENLEDHLRLILDGQYSSDFEDIAIIEERIVADSFFQDLCSGGVPDVRVIVFKGFPIMAMTRLPTEESGGEANMHKGAVGVGLTITAGEALHPFLKRRGKFIEEHPDTGKQINDFTVPGWENVLQIAVRASAASRLGYAGVDIVFDEEKGPVVLEVNKRPGMGVQNANMDGLMHRLQFIEDLPIQYEFKPPTEKVELAQQWNQNGWEVDDL